MCVGAHGYQRYLITMDLELQNKLEASLEYLRP